MYLDSSNSVYIDGKCYVAITYPFNHYDALLIEDLHIDKLVEYIQKASLKKGYVQNFSDFTFLSKCRTLEHIAIEFRMPFSEYSKLQRKNKIAYDLCSLENIPYLRSLDLRDNEREGSRAVTHIDIAKLPFLEMLSTDYRWVTNLAQGASIQTLQFHHFEQPNLTALSTLKKLDTLSLSFSKIESLFGLTHDSKLQCLYLYNNRQLRDISDLRYVSSTLKALRIENCPNIQDFSCLFDLSNLELLELSGKNILPSLAFLKEMPRLKTFVFSMNIMDGDLSLCQNLSWAYSEHNRKHYSHKDKDLPKKCFYHGNEGIDVWRRLE